MRRASLFIAALGGLWATCASAAPGQIDPGFTLSIMGDAYAGWQSAKVGTPQPGHRTFAATSPANTAENGFSLSFVGFDATWMSKGDAFGVVTNLRFGPSVPLYHGNSPALGIDNLVQGYVTWRPLDDLVLDLGQFTSIYGAESIDSFRNLNYTRGVLFDLTPFWHTGLRASYTISDALKATVIVVNGVDNISDDDEAPSVGAQITYAPSEKLSVSLGGLFAGDSATDPSGFDNYVDLAVNAGFGATTLIVNAFYNLNVDAALPDGTLGDAGLFGAAVMIGQAFTPSFGVAVRYELLNDADNTIYAAPGADSLMVQTATLTLDLKPFKGYDNCVLRWENRYETASEDIYLDGDAAATATWFTSIIGVAVHSDVIGGQ